MTVGEHWIDWLQQRAAKHLLYMIRWKYWERSPAEILHHTWYKMMNQTSTPNALIADSLYLYVSTCWQAISRSYIMLTCLLHFNTTEISTPGLNLLQQEQPTPWTVKPNRTRFHSNYFKLCATLWYVFLKTIFDLSFWLLMQWLWAKHRWILTVSYIAYIPWNRVLIIAICNDRNIIWTSQSLYEIKSQTAKLRGHLLVLPSFVDRRDPPTNIDKTG